MVRQLLLQYQGICWEVNMISRHEITKEQALYAIENEEFGSDVLDGENTVVIMTQNWCPQWINMKGWIYGLETDKEIGIYELVYNKTDFYRSFMEFKEKEFGNSLVPYLRFYKNGKLASETNYVNKERFHEMLNGL